MLSCSDDSKEKAIAKTSICMSHPAPKTFEADKDSYLAERGQSISFALNIEDQYKKQDIAKDSRVILRGLINNSGRYKSIKIIKTGITHNRYREGFMKLNGLEHYIHTVGVPDSVRYDPHNEEYRDTFISNTDDYLFITCTRLSKKLISPSCKIDYKYKSVYVSYYVSRLLLERWTSIKSDVDKYLKTIDNCKA